MNFIHRILFGKSAKAVKMAEATLDDGTQIQTDANEFAEGAQVYVITEEGDQIPLPDGEYTLDDGSVINVLGGTITALDAPEDTESEDMAADPAKAAPTKTDPATADAEPDMAAFIKSTTDALTAIQKSISDLAAKVDAADKEDAAEDAKEDNTEMSKQIAELKKQVQELSEKPSTTSIKKNSTPADNASDKTDKDARLKMLASIRSKAQA